MVAVLASAVLVTLVALARRPAQAMLLYTKLVLTPEQSTHYPLPPSEHQGDMSYSSSSFDAASNGVAYKPPTAEDGLTFRPEVLCWILPSMHRPY